MLKMPFDILTSGQKSIGSYFQLRLKNDWCPEAESNHRHEDFQSSALPTELSGQILISANVVLFEEARIKPLSRRCVNRD